MRCSVHFLQGNELSSDDVKSAAWYEIDVHFYRRVRSTREGNVFTLFVSSPGWEGGGTPDYGSRSLPSLITCCYPDLTGVPHPLPPCLVLGVGEGYPDLTGVPSSGIGPGTRDWYLTEMNIIKTSELWKFCSSLLALIFLIHENYCYLP